jgi:hypothetical protein
MPGGNRSTDEEPEDPDAELAAEIELGQLEYEMSGDPGLKALLDQLEAEQARRLQAAEESALGKSRESGTRSAFRALLGGRASVTLR